MGGKGMRGPEGLLNKSVFVSTCVISFADCGLKAGAGGENIVCYLCVAQSHEPKLSLH